MFMLDNVAKPLPQEKYPLVTYKTVTTYKIWIYEGNKNRLSSLDLKYTTEINL